MWEGRRWWGEMVVVVVSEHARPRCRPLRCHCRSHSCPLCHLVVAPPRCHCCCRHHLRCGIGRGCCVYAGQGGGGGVAIIVVMSLVVSVPLMVPVVVVVVLPLPLVVSLSLSSRHRAGWWWWSHHRRHVHPPCGPPSSSSSPSPSLLLTSSPWALCRCCGIGHAQSCCRLCLHRVSCACRRVSMGGKGGWWWWSHACRRVSGEHVVRGC